MALLGTLFDDFDNNSLNNSLWGIVEEGSATHTEQNKQTEFDLPASATAASLAQLFSDNTYDMTGSGMYAQITEVPNPATHANLEFMFQVDASNSVRWVYEFGTLFAQRLVGGVVTTITSFAYNGSTHAWWRIRQSGGVIFWDTSTDGQNWTNRASWTHTFAITSGEVAITCYCYQNETNPGGAALDNFNLNVHIGEAVDFDGESDMSADAKSIFHVDAITIDGEGDLLGLVRRTSFSSLTHRKSFEYKVFDKDGNYITSWPDVISDFGFNQEINTAGSAVQIQLARSIDTPVAQVEDLHTESSEELQTEAAETLQADYKSPNRVGPGTDVAVNNRIEVWVYYGSVEELTDQTNDLILTQDDETILLSVGAPNGMCIFKGIIQEYEADYGNDNTVTVQVASHGVQLDNYVLKNGETINVDYFSVDPAHIVRDALDNFGAQGGEVSHTPASVKPTGSIITQKFQLNTILEVLKQAVVNAPSNWFWYLDMGENNIYYQPKPSSVSHRFKLGRDIKQGKFKESIADLVNLVYFMGGNQAAEGDPDDYLLKKYSDATSITEFGQGLERKNDQRFTDEDSVTLLSMADINAKKNSRHAGLVEILSSDYDIESIRLGHLVGFANFGNFIDTLELLVAGTQYKPDSVILKLELVPPDVPKRVEDIKRNLQVTQQLNAPDAPS